MAERHPGTPFEEGDDTPMPPVSRETLDAAGIETTDWKPIRIGGLMRCCTETIRAYEGPQDEGTVLACRYCSETSIVRDGAWEWNRE